MGLVENLPQPGSGGIKNERVCFASLNYLPTRYQTTDCLCTSFPQAIRDRERPLGSQYPASCMVVTFTPSLSAGLHQLGF